MHACAHGGSAHECSLCYFGAPDDWTPATCAHPSVTFDVTLADGKVVVDVVTCDLCGREETSVSGKDI